VQDQKILQKDFVMYGVYPLFKLAHYTVFWMRSEGLRSLAGIFCTSNWYIL